MAKQTRNILGAQNEERKGSSQSLVTISLALVLICLWHVDQQYQFLIDGIVNGIRRQPTRTLHMIFIEFSKQV